MSIDVMRMLQLAAHRDHVHHIEIRVAEDVANYLLNKKRGDRPPGGVGQHSGANPRHGRAPPETLEYLLRQQQ